MTRQSHPVPITITITSDFICPWCLVGERRLGAALESLPHDVAVTLTWRPFELNPDMPLEGMNRKVYRSLKFGSWERSRILDAQTVEAAKDDDVAFDYAAIARTPNTFTAHRLAWLAARHGLQREIVAAVLSAYFERGRDIGQLDVLAEIAGEAGLDVGAVSTFLAGEDGAEEVRAAERAVIASGVRAVPHFDIGGTAVSVAQPEVALRDAVMAAHATGAPMAVAG